MLFTALERGGMTSRHTRLGPWAARSSVPCAHFFKDFVEKAKALVGAEAGFHCRGAFVVSSNADPDLQELFAQGIKLVESPCQKKKEKGQQQQMQKQKLPASERPWPTSRPRRRFPYVGVGIPPAAWTEIAAARGLAVDSAKTRWGQIKRKLGLNTTAKPLPEPAQRVRKAASGASGKGKAAGSSLAAKRAVVGAAEDLGNLQDDTDRSEDGVGKTNAYSFPINTTPTADVYVKVTTKGGETKYQCKIKKPGRTEWGAIIKDESTASAPTAASMIATIPDGLRIRAVSRTIHQASCLCYPTLLARLLLRVMALRLLTSGRRMSISAVTPSYRRPAIPRGEVQKIDPENPLNLHKRGKNMPFLVSVTTPTMTTTPTNLEGKAISCQESETHEQFFLMSGHGWGVWAVAVWFPIRAGDWKYDNEVCDFHNFVKKPSPMDSGSNYGMGSGSMGGTPGPGPFALAAGPFGASGSYGQYFESLHRAARRLTRSASRFPEPLTRSRQENCLERERRRGLKFSCRFEMWDSGRHSRKKLTNSSNKKNPR
ncbi:hypothetical protein DL768_005536 [Monosporascus sp. mg162]|nr:hypothetical protein DL768_005536 [Monosporascus sp. mg162]